jgi:hypothetical protein
MLEQTLLAIVKEMQKEQIVNQMVLQLLMDAIHREREERLNN